MNLFFHYSSFTIHCSFFTALTTLIILLLFSLFTLHSSLFTLRHTFFICLSTSVSTISLMVSSNSKRSSARCSALSIFFSCFSFFLSIMPESFFSVANLASVRAIGLAQIGQKPAQIGHFLSLPTCLNRTSMVLKRQYNSFLCRNNGGYSTS